MNPAERQYEQQATHRISTQRLGSGTIDNSQFNMLTTATSDSVTPTATAKRPRLESGYQRPPFSLPARLHRVSWEYSQVNKKKLIECIVCIGCIPRSSNHVDWASTPFTFKSKYGTIAVSDPVINVR